MYHLKDDIGLELKDIIKRILKVFQISEIKTHENRWKELSLFGLRQ